MTSTSPGIDWADTADYCRRICSKILTGADAEDAAQTTLALVFEKQHTFDPDRAKWLTWVGTIARNTCFSSLRQIYASRKVFSGSEPSADIAERIEDAPAIDLSVVDRLPTLQREAVMLFYAGGFSCREGSLILRCPIGTFKSRLRRGIKRLRWMLTYEKAHAS